MGYIPGMDLNRRNRSHNRSALSSLAVVGFAVAVVAGAAGALAGPLFRWNLLALGDAFTLLRWAAVAGLVGCAVCLPALIRAQTAGNGLLALAGLCVGAAVFWVPYSQQRLAREVPAIHDITTDTRNPPQFDAVLSLRPDNANSLRYGGESLAARQEKAYPDIVPLEIQAPPEAVLDAAAEVAREQGWRVVEASPGSGRIEAVDTTFWFGFRDDVVVRVSGTDGGARVDVRSVSRIGVSDIGKNAARIRAFLTALESRF